MLNNSMQNKPCTYCDFFVERYLREGLEINPITAEEIINHINSHRTISLSYQDDVRPFLEQMAKQDRCVCPCHIENRLCKSCDNCRTAKRFIFKTEKTWPGGW